MEMDPGFVCSLDYSNIYKQDNIQSEQKVLITV